MARCYYGGRKYQDLDFGIRDLIDDKHWIQTVHGHLFECEHLFDERTNRIKARKFADLIYTMYRYWMCVDWLKEEDRFHVPKKRHNSEAIETGECYLRRMGPDTIFEFLETYGFFDAFKSNKSNGKLVYFLERLSKFNLIRPYQAKQLIEGYELYSFLKNFSEAAETIAKTLMGDDGIETEAKEAVPESASSRKNRNNVLEFKRC